MLGITTRTVVPYYHLSVDDHREVIYRWCGSREYTATTIIWTIQQTRLIPDYKSVRWQCQRSRVSRDCTQGQKWYIFMETLQYQNAVGFSISVSFILNACHRRL